MTQVYLGNLGIEEIACVGYWLKDNAVKWEYDRDRYLLSITEAEAIMLKLTFKL